MAMRPYRLLYVPEITLRLRKGVHRETSAITARRPETAYCKHPKTDIVSMCR
jgi:hypothetical protein